MRLKDEKFYKTVRDFLDIYLIKHRGYSLNTQKSYREAINLLLLYRKDGTRFLMLATHSRRRISLHMLQVSVVKNGITHFHSGSIRSFAYSIVIA